MDLTRWSGKAVETATVWTDANQRVLRELVDFSAATAREGVKLYANVRYGKVNYGLWIAEGGSFSNTGDGGYINWAFRGWFDRVDNTVNFS